MCKYGLIYKKAIHKRHIKGNNFKNTILKCRKKRRHSKSVLYISSIVRTSFQIIKSENVP